jgi:hypothetical protein
MNKKIKLISLISAPILLGGGFAALTLVNQCSNEKTPNGWANVVENIYFRNGVELTTVTPQILVDGVSVEDDCTYTLNKLDDIDLPANLEFDVDRGVISGIPSVLDGVYYGKTRFSITAHYVNTDYTSPVFIIKDGTVGNIDGTDWEGYISGSLTVTHAPDFTSQIIRSNTYKANNLVMPDRIYYENNFYRLYSLNEQALRNCTFTGSLTLGGQIYEIGRRAFYKSCALVNKLTIINGIMPTDMYPFAIGEEVFSGAGSGIGKAKFTLIFDGFNYTTSGTPPY